MEFKLDRFDARDAGLDLYQIIYATGEIVPGDAALLDAKAREWKLIPGAVIYFHSLGGNLLEGMRLGETIRRLRFETQIGIEGNVRGEKTAYCLSACALAFLGGEYRTTTPNSLFGVHRFAASKGTMTADAAQIGSALVVAYMNEMGVETGLMTYMASAGSDDIELIDQPTLEALRVVTGDTKSLSWEWNYSGGFTWLRGVHEGRRGINKLTFACLSGKVVMMALHGSSDPKGVIASTKQVNWIINGVFTPFLAGEAMGPAVDNNSYVIQSVSVRPERFRMLLAAREIGVAFIQSEGMYAGFSMSSVDGRDKLGEIGKTCKIPVG